MKNAWVYILPLVYVICDRLYPTASDFLWALVWHSVGSNINTVATLTVMVLVIPDNRPGLRIVTKSLLVWRVVALFFHCFIQFTSDHTEKISAWADGFRGSGSTYFFGKLGFIQELFVVYVIIFIIIRLQAKSVELKHFLDRGRYGIRGRYNKTIK